MKKYQVITYSRYDGLDEKLEFSRKRDAESYAKKQLYTNSKGYGLEDGAIVYDTKNQSIVSIFGHFPEECYPTCEAQRTAVYAFASSGNFAAEYAAPIL